MSKEQDTVKPVQLKQLWGIDIRNPEELKGPYENSSSFLGGKILKDTPVQFLRTIHAFNEDEARKIARNESLWRDHHEIEMSDKDRKEMVETIHCAEILNVSVNYGQLALFTEHDVPDSYKQPIDRMQSHLRDGMFLEVIKMMACHRIQIAWMTHDGGHWVAWLGEYPGQTKFYAIDRFYLTALWILYRKFQQDSTERIEKIKEELKS